MPGQCRTINGVQYERDLLDRADRAERESGGRQLGKALVEELWEMAMDGNKVTETERRTLVKIAKDDNFIVAAKSLLHERLKSVGTGSSSKRHSHAYYKSINAVLYKGALLEKADEYSKAGRISLQSMLNLWALAHDGKGVTETERRTLKYILDNYSLADDAKLFIADNLQVHPSPAALGDAPPGAVSSAAGSPPTPAALVDAPRGSKPSAAAAGLSPAAAALVDAPRGSKRSADEGALSPAPPVKATRLLAADNGGSPFPRSEVSPSPSMKELQDNPRSASRSSLLGGLRRAVSTVLGISSGGAQGADSHAAPSVSTSIGSGTSAAARIEDPGTAHLSPALRDLLSGDDKSVHSIEWTAPTGERTQSDLAQQEAAAVEVKRILAAGKVSQILGGGSRDEQHREFKRLALLLHPDKGVVAKTDADANLAWRLLLAALQKARKSD